MPDESDTEANAPTPADPTAHPTVPEQLAAHHLEAGHHHGHGQLPRLKFIEEIKRRNVGRVAILYIIVSYVVLEVFEMFYHLLEMPSWTGRAAVLLAVVGFPIALLLAWAYEITPEGLKPTDEVAPQKSIARQTGKRLDRAIIIVLAVALSYFVVDKFWLSKRVVATAVPVSTSAPLGASAIGFNPPPHSIAVLPFANLSGDPGQEYFSDGLTDEILNSLSTIEGLQVVARTSSFSFKGKDTDIGAIAHRLNVGAVLEGSVRRSEHSVRVTAQLIDAVTGYHLWSKTYDEESGDVLKLQTEIATAVAQALQVTLQGNAYEKIVLGGTNNLAAFDALQRARKAYQKSVATSDTKAFQDAIDAATEAIRLDPNYARAFAARSGAYINAPASTAASIEEFNKKALADAQQAIAVAPSLATSHVALANYFFYAALDFARANEEFEKARVLLEPTVCIECARAAIYMGDFEPGLAAWRRAVELNPLDFGIHVEFTEALYASRRYQEVVATAKQDISSHPDNQVVYGILGLAYYGLGDYEHARTTCEAKSDYWECQQCLAVTYEKLGRHADAEAALAKLDALGDAATYQNAAIYAQWGNVPKALEWLDTAMRLRDGGLLYLKTDPLMDPLRKEPRFEAIMRELKFPP
jgi:serine/threonine-protein kinase